ncbi:MAG: hypothetical protein HY376_02595 [Candidatus Blackburnbacteria bacterium]|nr:hypothetical protein [Candidatus Blackburnbacteria bacterium]
MGRIVSPRNILDELLDPQATMARGIPQSGLLLQQKWLTQRAAYWPPQLTRLWCTRMLPSSLI